MATIKEFVSCRRGETNSGYDNLFQGENGYVAYISVRCTTDDAVGAYAFVVYHNGDVFSEAEQAFQETTCNRLSMRAIIDSIKTCPKGSYVTVYTNNDCCITILKNEKRGTHGDLHIKFYKTIESVEGVRIAFAERNFQPKIFDYLKGSVLYAYRNGERRRDRLER